MNPFDLSGPEFLVLYGLLFFASILGSLLVHFWPRRPDYVAGAEGRLTDPNEIAYLRGGEGAAIEASLAGLHHARVLSSQEERQILFHSSPLPHDATPMEQAVYFAIPVGGSASLSDVRSRARAATKPLGLTAGESESTHS